MTTTNDLNNDQLNVAAPQQDMQPQENLSIELNKEQSMIISEQPPVTADVADPVSISEPDTELAEIVASTISFTQQVVHADSKQLLLMALAIEASYLAEVNNVPSVLKIKVGESGHNVDDIANVLAQQTYCSTVDEHLQSAVFRNHCKNNPYATCISAYKGNPAKHMRTTDNNKVVQYGTQFIVHQNTLSYKDGEEGLIDTITLAALAEGTTLPSPNDFTDLEKAKLDINSAKRKLWLLQNKQRVLEMMTSCTLSKPENFSDKVFNAWKLILVLGSLMGHDELDQLNAMMQASNVLVDKLSKNTALLIDMKVLTERAKALYPNENGIASVMLIGQLQSLNHQQWDTEINTKSLSGFMGALNVKPQSIKHDFISTSGYLFSELEAVFIGNLDLTQPLQRARHDDVTAMIMPPQAA